jgi:hypothetical protein
MTNGGNGRDRAFVVLSRALGDDDHIVRERAALSASDPGAPDAYVDALLRRLEAKDPAMGVACLQLPRLADRPAFLKRVEALLDAYAINWQQLPEVPHEAAALLLAKRVARELKQGTRDSGVYNLAYRCAGASPKAAAALLFSALEFDDPHLVTLVAGGMGKQDCVAYLGDHVPTLRAAALASAPGPEESGNGAHLAVINLLGLNDFQVVVDALRRRRDRGMPTFLLLGAQLDALGAGKAGALVEFCRDEKDVMGLLAAGRFFLGRDDKGVEFYRQVLPKAGSSAAVELAHLAGFAELAPLVAERLLSAGGPEWGWVTEPPRPQPAWPVTDLPVEKYPGPHVWGCLRVHPDLFTTPPLRALLAQSVDDPRFEIALAAATAAAWDETEAGTAALRKALQSRWPEARGMALSGLVQRVADAPALVREFAARKDLTPEDRSAIAGVIFEANDPAVTSIAQDLIKKGPAWGVLWGAYSERAPKDAVNLAITLPPTEESLGVLVKAADPRRIEVFRAVLNGTDPRAIRVVLKAVCDQYLVELGEEALAQLRNPDEQIREVASATIERLKFYAEAKKAFQK